MIRLTNSTVPPAAKKRKTDVPVVGDEEVEKPANGTKADQDNGEEEQAADTAEKSAPAEAAAKAKGGDVPKESDLPEVEAQE